MVWSCLTFIRSGQNYLARHSERGKKTRQTEEEVGRQHQGMDRPGVRQVQEGSGEQRKMEETGKRSSSRKIQMIVAATLNERWTSNCVTYLPINSMLLARLSKMVTESYPQNTSSSTEKFRNLTLIWSVDAMGGAKCHTQCSLLSYVSGKCGLLMIASASVIFPPQPSAHQHVEDSWWQYFEQQKKTKNN